MSNKQAMISVEGTVEKLIDRAFEEDVRSGDVTTNAIVDKETRAEAVWIAKEDGIIAGIDIARTVFEKLDPQIQWNPSVHNGDAVTAGTELVAMDGAGRAVLTAERIALNIAQRMAGIATAVSKYVQAIVEFDTQVLDTRKTVPGLRHLDKLAVKTGGGTNHRMGLYDLAMIKDNHIVAAGSIAEAVQQVRAYSPNIEIEVETSSFEEVKQAQQAGADIIMLDNMSLAEMEEAVSWIDGRAKTEASGNITLNTIREVAETGVDFISVGALTHSVKAFDISQQLQQIYK